MLAAGLASMLGCADTDPDYGPPGIIKGRQVDFGIDAGAAEPIPEAAPTTKSAVQLFADLFATMTDTTGKAGSPCIPCHATTQSPVFMAGTAEETRAKFKTNGYQTLATSAVYKKMDHASKALVEAQKVIFRQWAAAEAAPGGGGG
jgi:hypothetical protein